MKFDLLPFSGVKKVWDFREEPENLRMLGTYVWRVLLALAVVALVCAAWLGMQELNAVTLTENVTEPSSAPPAALDPNALSAQLSAFSIRQEAYQALSASPLPQVADPSK